MEDRYQIPWTQCINTGTRGPGKSTMHSFLCVCVCVCVCVTVLHSYSLLMKSFISSFQFVLFVCRHFQKAGFNYTLADVSNWAKRPFPGRDIFIIGDAYNTLRGWTEGAILSANNALFEGWHLNVTSSELLLDQFFKRFGESLNY